MLSIVAVVLIIGWLLGFFAFHVGGIIHILLVIAVIAILIRVIQGGKQRTFSQSGIASCGALPGFPGRQVRKNQKAHVHLPILKRYTWAIGRSAGWSRLCQ